jgi:hypothetical protein
MTSLLVHRKKHIRVCTCTSHLLRGTDVLLRTMKPCFLIKQWKFVKSTVCVCVCVYIYIYIYIYILGGGSRSSSVSIVSDYGLDDRPIEVRSPAEARGLFLYVSRPALGPPSLLSNGYRGPFPGAKARPGRDAGHSPPSGAEVVNEKELYLLSPLAPP